MIRLQYDRSKKLKIKHFFFLNQTVWIVFFFLHEHVCCGYSLEAPCFNWMPKTRFHGEIRKTFRWYPSCLQLNEHGIYNHSLGSFYKTKYCIPRNKKTHVSDCNMTVHTSSRYGKCPKISNTKVSDIIAYANSADPDQTAPEGAVWSGSSLFAIPLSSWRKKCIMKKQTLGKNSMIESVWNFRTFTVRHFFFQPNSADSFLISLWKCMLQVSHWGALVGCF